MTDLGSGAKGGKLAEPCEGKSPVPIFMGCCCVLGRHRGFGPLLKDPVHLLWQSHGWSPGPQPG